jgi:glycosyltransferase involved in cell wall biosynthesis
MKPLIIIPAYNEEGSLKRTVEALTTATPDMDFIVVNDGSRDNTYQICQENHYPVINMPFNLGLANAVQTGMRYAYENGYDMALQFDGDGQHLPEYITEMMKRMQSASADIVIGSRHMKNSSKSLRRLGGIFLSLAIKIVTGKKLTDPTSGMRLFNKKMIGVFAHQMNHGPEPDTVAYLMKKGAHVIEIPVTMQERKAGKSYLSALNAVSYMLRMFVSIMIVHWFRAKE